MSIQNKWYTQQPYLQGAFTPQGEPLRKLVVLTPACKEPPVSWFYAIRKVALKSNLPVCLLGIMVQPGQGLLRFLQISELAAHLRLPNVPVMTHLSEEDSWPKALKEIHQPGDLYVCTAEQSFCRSPGLIPLGLVPSPWRKHENLGAWINQTYHWPVYLLKEVVIYDAC